jgi:hypothetical protein
MTMNPSESAPQTPCNGVSTGQKVATAPAVDAAAAQKPTSALPTPCNGVSTGQAAAASYNPTHHRPPAPGGPVHHVIGMDGQ